MYQDLIQALKSKNVLVVGDSCIDKSIYLSDSGRKGTESAGIDTIYKESSTFTSNGMSGKVVEILAQLGVNPTLKYINIGLGIPVKTRIYLDDKLWFRYDIDYELLPISADLFITHSKFDLIIISDYCKGSITDEFILAAIATGIPVFLDTKKRNLEDFSGALIKINEHEYKEATSLPSSDFIVTFGSRGSVRFKNKEMYRRSPCLSKAPVSTIGAGDSYLCGLAVAKLLKLPLMKTANILAAMFVDNEPLDITTLLNRVLEKDIDITID